MAGGFQPSRPEGNMDYSDNRQKAHGDGKFAQIAIVNEVYRTQVGSGLHGVTVGDDDRDEMGICIEPPQYVIGNDNFEQYIYRTQPEGHRSGAGDIDLVIYSLRKWTRLAAAGNPTVLMLLFVPNHEIVVDSEVGRELRANSDMFLSKDVAARFIGYMVSQRDQMLGVKGKKHTNRPELVEKYGFDTKFAYHMLRLGIQGIEILTTGKVNLPMKDEHRAYLKDVRAGKYRKEDVLAYAEALLAELRELEETVDLPNKPDLDRLNRWLVDTYTEHWVDSALI